MVDAAQRAGLDADIVTCAGWQVRDLLRHIGAVHQWAAAHIVDRRAEELEGDLEDVVGGWPPDGDLVAWARERHDNLVTALNAADPDYPYWTWRPAKSPLMFWARRQAHETAIHRADAASAERGVPSFSRPFAVDGIDELVLDVVGARRGTLPLDAPTVVAFEASDHPRRWWASMAPEGFTVGTGDHPADCEVRAPASVLYRLVWHRAGDDECEITGDLGALARWWEQVAIRWT